MTPSSFAAHHDVHFQTVRLAAGATITLPPIDAQFKQGVVAADDVLSSTGRFALTDREEIAVRQPGVSLALDVKRF